MVTPGTAAQFKNLTASGTPYDKAQTQVGTADQLQMVLMDAGILTEEGAIWTPSSENQKLLTKSEGSADVVSYL